MALGLGAKISKRRVPESERRRAQISCDRCKTKRIRCARSLGSESCEACLESGVACKSSIPRMNHQERLVQSLGIRHKALEALIKGLFPRENCEDNQTLFRLAAERSIPMPNSSQTPVPYNGLSSQNGGEDVEGVSLSDSTTTQHVCLDHPSITSTSTVIDLSRSSLMADVPWPCNIDPAVQGAVTSLPEETCIPAPHGVAHYVGPASSFEFASAIRRLVALRSESLEDSLARRDRRSKLRADFTSLKTSIALEPRIQAHPASTVREPGDSESSLNHPPSLTMNEPRVAANEAETDRQSFTPNRMWLRALLPSREISDSLVKAFFDRLHPNYVLFHRGTFHSRYESIWLRSPKSRYDHDNGWLCSLFMVFIFGAQLLEQNGLARASDLQRQFLRLVRERFHHLALTASLANVQALLLLQLYEHNAGERNTSWILLGQASRMAIALGMHREGTSHNFDVIERNTRRMVWFTLYSFEQYVSLSLGRPSTIKALEVNIRLPDESVTDGSDYPPDYLVHASALLNLCSKVRHFATAASPHCSDEKFLLSMLDSHSIISRELTDWSKSLARHIRPDWCFISPRHRRAVVLLHINYHHICSVLTRPYLLCKVERDLKCQTSPESSSTAVVGPSVFSLAQDCVSSSNTVADLLNQLSSESLLEGLGWTDFFYLYHAMLVLCLDFLGRPTVSPEEWSARDREISANVSYMIEMCQTTHLGPTYQILSQVAIQFARIVCLARDGSVSRDDSGPNQGRPISQSASEAGVGEHNSNITTNNNIAPMSQHGIFMPYAEPMFGVSQFNTNDTLWNFFDIDEGDFMDSSMYPALQYTGNSFLDPFADPASHSRF